MSDGNITTPTAPVLSDAQTSIPSPGTLLPRWLLVSIAVVVTLFLIAIVCLGLFLPQRLQSTTGKFFVCFGLSFCFSVVMYFIYPHSSRLSQVPYLNLAVDVVGPAALFIIALAFLWRLYPDLPAVKPQGRFYLLRENGQPAQFHIGTFRISSAEGNCQFHTVRGIDEPNLVGGVYAEFKGDADKCAAKVEDPYAQFSGTFDRVAETNLVELRTVTQ